MTWLGRDSDEPCTLGNDAATHTLLQSARAHAESVGVPLDGWGQPPTILTPKENLNAAIRSTWPELAD